MWPFITIPLLMKKWGHIAFCNSTNKTIKPKCKEGMKLNGRSLRASAHGRSLAAQRLPVFSRLEENTLKQKSLDARAVNLPWRFQKRNLLNFVCGGFVALANETKVHKEMRAHEGPNSRSGVFSVLHSASTTGSNPLAFFLLSQ
jgi:hypothetical protein